MEIWSDTLWAGGTVNKIRNAKLLQLISLSLNALISCPLVASGKFLLGLISSTSKFRDANAFRYSG